MQTHFVYMYMSCVHTVYVCVCVGVCTCARVCPWVCSWVSTHCQVMEAARKVKEEVESTSDDCSEELIQLEVGHVHAHACTHTHARTHTYTYMCCHTRICTNVSTNVH